MTKDRAKTAYPISFPLDVPTTWTPDQALAVFELLDDLRDQIGAHYSVQLFELNREQHLHARTDRDDSNVDDQSF